MSPQNTQCSDKTVRRWILWGIPVALILGGLTHFAFEFSGESTVVGILAPVNESVWEHLKMSFWVPLLWWIVGYAVLGRKCGLRTAGWFAACAAALYIAPLFITAFYYFFKGAFGAESLALDLVSFLLGIVLAQTAACHIYKYARVKDNRLIWPVLLIALLAAALIVFTFAPPELPLFLDGPSGTYGI